MQKNRPTTAERSSPSRFMLASSAARASQATGAELPPKDPAESIIAYLARTSSGRTDARNASERLAARAAAKSMPALLDSAPAWWTNIPEPVKLATTTFDQRHEHRMTRAQRLHAEFQRDSLSTKKAAAWRQEIFEVRTNRYVAPQQRVVLAKSEGKKKYAKAEAAPVELDLRNTIWVARHLWCDAKDFYDNDDIKRKRFALDWKYALDTLNLAKFIMQSDLDGDGTEEIDSGVTVEVEEVGAVLWGSADLIFRLFTYYAALGDDVFGISFNEWGQFVEDQKVADKRSKLCKKRDTDRIFLAIDATSARYFANMKKELLAKEKDGKLKDDKGRAMTATTVLARDTQSDRMKSLSRVEFTAALVHIAIAKYISCNILQDVSEAVERLLTRDLKPHPKVILDPDQFRRDHCYTRPVIDVLLKHEQSLRNIFIGVAGGGGRTGKGSELISLEEWTNFLHGLQFIGIDLTLRDAHFAFCWSRMGVINGRTDRGSLKESCLPFEGFLEAVCRVATMKALPTDEEIKAAKHKHAGAYLAAFEEADDVAYKDFLTERATPWGDEPTLQPVARCVDHLVAMIIHIMEVNVAGTDNLQLTEHEAVSWFKANNIYTYH